MNAENMPDFSALIGPAGEPVPVVDPADLKAIWKQGQEVQARHPGGLVAVAAGVYQQVCSPGADVRAAAFRSGMLGLLHHMIEPVFAGGQPTESAFKVAARVELKWMPVGVVQEGLGFDLDRFFAEVHAESQGAS